MYRVGRAREGVLVNPLELAVGLLLILAAIAIGFAAGRRWLPAGGRAGAHASAATQAAGAAMPPPGSFRRLEEYDVYPFLVNDDGHVEFSPDAFDRAVGHFLEERNPRAAGELIVIGEQNLVRDTFPSDRLERYKALYLAYDGDGVVSDNDLFLENYRRIVNHVGRSFPNTGIEILLHNLVNPSRSLVAIENAAVTGRAVGSGATNLVLDLKTRRQRGEDKINYELNIGSRQFKCTTIPIFRPDYGLVGAICINVDTRFLREYVAQSEERLAAFFDNFLRTDFQLGENILSRDEYVNALNGKRHFLDEAIRSASPTAGERRLAAIFFSDIVGFTALMGRDEAATMRIVEANEQIHRAVLARHRGRLLKKLGDGMLTAFDSASDAVEAARAIQRDVRTDGRFQVRIGIHLGEVLRSGGDVHGDGVNIAARIQGEMGPGEIGISSVVYDNVRNKEGVIARPLGERTLKNVAFPVALYSVEI
jgi:class 3 adenylate cyclase